MVNEAISASVSQSSTLWPRIQAGVHFEHAGIDQRGLAGPDLDAPPHRRAEGHVVEARRKVGDPPVGQPRDLLAVFGFGHGVTAQVGLA